ncbi:MAG: type III-A CRISPR-associated protein Cas10/Csm1 [Anaerolineales bacterium]|nr:type III-A CRISPR-associated protein Cas10/Csm1 [Anaerolineales bacterium]
MEEKVFQAALGGLLQSVSEFAKRTTEPVRISELIPAQWYSAIYDENTFPGLNSSLEQVVSMAAQLAAGGASLISHSQPEQLASIFCSLGGLTDGQQQPVPAPPAKYLPIAALSIDETVIFPQAKASDTTQAYKNLWIQFSQALTRLKRVYEAGATDAESYLNNLLRLMQRYCWCIPVMFGETQSDVSLYDHGRITSALAACSIDRKETNDPKDVALLVGGDISEVQKFIYTITSRGATSGLRGRSMYLQLLTEVVARFVLNRIEMPLTNLIYAGGGHFYLLAPVNKKTQLLEAQQYISQVLLHHHQGDLYLAVASEIIQAEEFAGQFLPEKWRDLQRGLQKAKQQPFTELADQVAELLFAPQEHGGNEEKLCQVCQREHPGTEEREKARKCPVCIGFEELGKDLREAVYYCLDEIDTAPLPKKDTPPASWQDILAHFGYRAGFYELKQQLPPLDPSVKRRTLLALNDSVLAELTPGPRQVTGRHLLVNITPTLVADEFAEFEKKIKDLPKPGSVKPFEVMTEQAEGIKRLGILRMDVDNLGQIFSKGLGTRATLTRIASLSFAVSLFFEGWLEQIAREVNDKEAKLNQGRQEPRGLIYSIYSGGDDLFFVGAWDLMLLLAERIKQDLHRYASEHIGVHVSGGVALAGSKYPLYQAAEDAHEAEQAAKARRPDGQSKNALNFLGQTVPWDKFAEIKQRQQTLKKMVAAEIAPTALLQRLIQLYVEYEQANRELAQKGQSGKVYWGPWHWHSAYTLTRLADRVKKQDATASSEILAIRDALRLEAFTNIEWVGLAARWAELLVRD